MPAQRKSYTAPLAISPETYLYHFPTLLLEFSGDGAVKSLVLERHGANFVAHVVFAPNLCVVYRQPSR